MSMIKEFREFAVRGNVVDMAVGIIIGGAFGTIAKSLVSDVIMPPVGLLLADVDFVDLFLVLKGDGPFATLADAQAAGAVTLNYGAFLTHLLTFLVVALAVFVLVRAVKRASEQIQDEFGAAEADTPDQPDTKKCAYCREAVPFKASRCSHCTSFLGTDGGPLTPDGTITPGGPAD